VFDSIKSRKSQNTDTIKSEKLHPLPNLTAESGVFEIAAFLLSSNIKIRRTKKISRGRIKIFFLQAKKIEGDIALIRLSAWALLSFRSANIKCPASPFHQPRGYT
jgi:hypothetical protein